VINCGDKRPLARREIRCKDARDMRDDADVVVRAKLDHALEGVRLHRPAGSAGSNRRSSAQRRAYLDDMPIAEFDATVVPFLDARTGVVGCIRYTRDLIDAWIGQGERTGEPRVANLARTPDAAETQGVDLLERFGLITEEDLAALLGISVGTLKNRPCSDLPEFVKAGRRRLFKEASVRTHLEARTVGRDALATARLGSRARSRLS
jgi:hypothetical protein